MFKHIFPEFRKPQRSGYAGSPFKGITAVHRIERKKPCQRIPGNAGIQRCPLDSLIRCRNNFCRQDLQIFVCSPRSWRIVLRQRRTAPRRHIVIPLKFSNHEQIAVRCLQIPKCMKSRFSISHHRIPNDKRLIRPLCRIERNLFFMYLKSDFLHHTQTFAL